MKIDAKMIVEVLKNPLPTKYGKYKTLVHTKLLWAICGQILAPGPKFHWANGPKKPKFKEIKSPTTSALDIHGVKLYNHFWVQNISGFYSDFQLYRNKKTPCISKSSLEVFPVRFSI